MKKVVIAFGLLVVGLLSGCAQQSCDYTAFNANAPRSILVLLPQNNTANIDATHAFLSQVTMPLAEAGYYVMPVIVAEQVFYSQGVTVAKEMHDVSPQKLRQVFNADAAIYMNIEQYGYGIGILSSAPEVKATAKLVDLRSGTLLSQGEMTVTGDSTSHFNLLGLLLRPLFDQISDKYYPLAGTANHYLFSPESGKGMCMLPGPYKQTAAR